MSETADIAPSLVSEKPVHANDNDTVKFPPLPEPTDDDFDEGVEEEEKEFYKSKFPDLNDVKKERLHCSACDRHLGCSARNESRMRMHPMLKTLVCHTCHSFYNSGEFDKGDDGSELYCRWCGQGGQVYCCSDCPVVFCAKCIKRNFGMPKIKEIENTDDWKCFKCNPKCLWDLRAVCWALLRFCDLRNKITFKTSDSSLKETYQKLCAVDESECCKSRQIKKKEKDLKRKAEHEAIKKAANVVNKLPATIQVKKFASITPDDQPKEKKKRPSSPKVISSPKVMTPKPPAILAPKQVFMANRMINPVSVGPFPKKIRLPVMPQAQSSVRFPTSNTYIPRYRPRASAPPMQMNSMLNNFNSYNNHMMSSPVSDNINLSLESLTQGLDMSAIANLAGVAAGVVNNNDVVCTPDFPLEPLCEVTEDANDDDVECITPAPAPSAVKPPPLVPRALASKDLASDNIIQMTEDDVTVNEATGGLKFRVDPQTLSSNKMYRLPDGRVFAIHANPSMPGGYSATIVAVTDPGVKPPRQSTFAAKLSAVPSPPVPPLAPSSPPGRGPPRPRRPRKQKITKSPVPPVAQEIAKVDLKVPVEWYRYNLIDAVDALEYSLTRLQKLKKEATTMYLRSRTLEEMQSLHKTLDHLLKTSSTRFNEIRENLNTEVKQYSARKKQASSNNISDDDDVEILNDVEDPIFIDENSVDSTTVNETNSVSNEVDLTGHASSEHNDSGDKSMDLDKDPLEDSTSKHVSQDVIEEFITNDSSTEILDESTLKDVSQTNSPKDSAEDRETVEKSSQNLDGNGDGEPKEKNASPKENDPKDKDADVSEINGDIDEPEDNPDNETAKDNAEINNKQDKDRDISDTKVNDTEISDTKMNDTEISDTKMNDTDMNDTDMNDTEMTETNKRDKFIEEVSHKTDSADKDANKDSIKDNNVEPDKDQDTEMCEDLIDSLLKDDNSAESANMEIPEDFQEP